VASDGVGGGLTHPLTPSAHLRAGLSAVAWQPAPYFLSKSWSQKWEKSHSSLHTGNTGQEKAIRDPVAELEKGRLPLCR
jgi:hypothetical protein